MSASVAVKQLMLDKGMSVKDLAALLEIKPQSVSNKLYRNNFTVEEFVKIANLLGASVMLVADDTHKQYQL